MADTAGAAFWDERYGGETYAYGLAPNAFLASRRADLHRGMAALVPGDGEGRNGVWLAEQGLVVDSFDLSAEGVAKARRLAAERGVALDAVQADAGSWEWPQGRYDLVALLYVHLVAPDRRALHARALSALKPGGRIVIEAFTPNQIERQKAGARGGPRDVALLYRAEDLRADFAGAAFEVLQEVETDLREGALHVGPGAVVRAVVRRA